MQLHSLLLQILFLSHRPTPAQSVDPRGLTRFRPHILVLQELPWVSD